MPSPAEILITGMGWVTPLGISPSAVWTALASGRSGIDWRSGYGPENAGPEAIGGSVREFDGRLHIKPRKAMKVMCDEIQFGHSAAMMAVEQSGLDLASTDLGRFSVIFGAETFQGDPAEVQSAVAQCTHAGEFRFGEWGERSMKEIQPLWMLKYLPNMVASHISIALAATGPNNTICQGDVSSAIAMIEAATLIERGWASLAIAGGTGSRVHYNCRAGRNIGDLSHDFASPETASRPFHPERNGFVAGEGAAALLLESRDSADRRGAVANWRLAGWARGFCPRSADRDAMAGSLADIAGEAVQRSGIAWNQFSHINSNGLGAWHSDDCEAEAIRLIGERLGELPPAIAIKSQFGNPGAGSALMELSASLLALQNRQIPPTLNVLARDHGRPFPLNGSLRDCQRPACLKISFTGTGQIVALVVERI